MRLSQVARKLSIRARMLLLAVSSVGAALSITCISLLVYNVDTVRNSTVKQLQLQASMLGFNSSAALTFQDADAAEQLLSSLKTFPSVETAHLADSEGVVLATFPAGLTGPYPVPEDTKPFEFTDDGWLLIRHPVVDGEETIGTVVLRANLDDFYDGVRDYVGIVGTVMAFSMALAVLLSVQLQRTISRPIARLVEAAKKVTQDGDYSIRVRWNAQNELGQLCSTFDQMLDEIQHSKNELQAAHDDLERRVEKRTAQLTDEIQERKRVLKDLERAKDAAEAANRAKSEFLANMSHEIRTPLNGVLGFTNLLAKEIAQEPGVCRDYLQTIESCGKHLLTLINDVLDISKIEAGQLEVEAIPCSPHEVITQVTSVLRAQAQQKGLALEYGWASRVPSSIVSDPARCRQLLMNLVGNAIKFTEQGHVRITARLDEDNEQLSISVEDTGIGISQEKKEAIFEPFVQADTSVTRRFGGTGLGLAISRRLARAMGGDLEAESSQGQGSRFTARIATGSLDEVTLFSSVESDALNPQPVDTEEQSQPLDLTDAKILVVDDGPTNRKLIKVILEEVGAVVALAENGQVGWELARSSDFDAVLMDMQMPVMDGYTATEKLRAAGVTIPIIGLTAHALSGDKEKCLQAGCCGFLTKPIDADKLVKYLSSRLAPDRREAVEVTDTEASQPFSHEPLRSSLPTEKPIYAEIVAEFGEYLTSLLEEVTAQLAAHEFPEIAKHAHSLKGAGGSAGFAAFTEPARQLEEAAHNSDFAESERLIDELRGIANRIELPNMQSQETGG